MRTTTSDNSQKPNVSSKRKLDVSTHDPFTFYKSAKRDVNGTLARTNGKTATITEDLEEDNDVAGPSLPLEDGDENDAEDEEGGRFFGGGIGGETKEVLDFMDRQDEEEAAPEAVDTSWLKKTALNFERRISRNSELRAKFEDSPEKYVRLPCAHHGHESLVQRHLLLY